MDQKQFDAVARAVAGTKSRRTVLATLAGFAVFATDEAAARNTRKRRRRRKQRQAGTCYPGQGCVAGQGRDSDGCDFSGSNAFHDANLQGARLSNTNLSGINAMRANLQGADLRGACIVETNLFEANLQGADLRGAIFCNTMMPDGSMNVSGCDQATACCPACLNGACPPQETCVPLGNLCNVTPFFPKCCPESICTAGIPSKYAWITWCQDPKGCTTDANCEGRHADIDVSCEDDGFLGCPGLLTKCCRNKRCLIDSDCPKSHTCCSFLDLGIARCCAPGQRCTVVGCL